jgi:hypothetical protein
MITKEQIEQASNLHKKLLQRSLPEGESSLIIKNSDIDFISGAEWVLEQCPYSKSDIAKIVNWITINGYYFAGLMELWYNDETEDTSYTIEEIIELWEEQK